MIRLKITVSLLLVLQLFLGAITPASTRPFSLNDEEGAAPSTLRGAQRVDDDQMKKGLQFRLSEGGDQPGRQTPAIAARATSLSESDLQQVLRRLPAIKTEEGDEQDFALRDSSLPAPRTGKITDVAFPPPERPAVPESGSAGPLEVLRYSPEGDV